MNTEGIIVVIDELADGGGEHLCKAASRWVANGWRVPIARAAGAEMPALPPEVTIETISTADARSLRYEFMSH